MTKEKKPKKPLRGTPLTKQSVLTLRAGDIITYTGPPNGRRGYYAVYHRFGRRRGYYAVYHRFGRRNVTLRSNPKITKEGKIYGYIRGSKFYINPAKWSLVKRGTSDDTYEAKVAKRFIPQRLETMFHQINAVVDKHRKAIDNHLNNVSLDVKMKIYSGLTGRKKKLLDLLYKQADDLLEINEQEEKEENQN